MEEIDWDDKGMPLAVVGQQSATPAPEEKFDPIQYARCGTIDPETLECILVGRTMYDKVRDKSQDDPERVNLILEAGLKADWFENKWLSQMFTISIDFFRQHRKMIDHNSIGSVALAKYGATGDQSVAYGCAAAECLGASQAWHSVPLEILVDRMISRHQRKTIDKLYQKFAKEYSSQGLGPKKAVDAFRASVITDLGDPRGGLLKEYDWIANRSETVAWLDDMKLNPEKYMGYLCGIKAIDERIHGFRNGQLSVFVGGHGGFKSTMMLCCAYGAWERGHDVLYLSLEMEAKLIETKLWCRGTTTISFSRLYNGGMIVKKDIERVKEMAAALEKDNLTDKERADLTAKHERLRKLVDSIGGDEKRTDEALIEEFEAKRSGCKNKIVILNIGQSKKIKMSQVENYLMERRTTWRPQLVIVDYLALVDPEVSRGDKKHEELGDICKYMRAMGENLGFSVVTAAQLKRAAIERLRKYGLDQPDKASFGTDDIADSSSIGADADNVMILWREDGGNRLRVFYPKCRHGIPDVAKGETLQVAPDICYVGSEEEIENTRDKAALKGPVDMFATADKAADKERGRIPDEEDLDDDEPVSMPTEDDDPVSPQPISMDDL